MMKKVAITLGTLVLVGALAATGFGRGMGGRGFGDHSHGLAYTDLTEEQHTELDALWEQFDYDTAELRDEIQTKRDELHAMLDESDIDAEAARAQQTAISDLMTVFGQYKIDFILDARKIVPDGDLPLGLGYGRSHWGGYWPGAWW